jgi:hypothetical protein
MESSKANPAGVPSCAQAQGRHTLLHSRSAQSGVAARLGMFTCIALCAAARLVAGHPGGGPRQALEQVLELRSFVTLPPGVLGADVDGDDIVGSQQSCERVLGDRLLHAPAPLSPRTTLDLSQLAREPFRGDLPKLTEDVADRSERLLQELPLLWRLINPRLFRL